jgi:hypothetical protein
MFTTDTTSETDHCCCSECVLAVRYALLLRDVLQSHNKVALVNKFNELYPAYSKNMVASSLRTVAVYETR